MNLPGGQAFCLTWWFDYTFRIAFFPVVQLPRSCKNLAGILRLMIAVAEPFLLRRGERSNKEWLMVDPKLLEILRCPACVREKSGRLTLIKDSWLVCTDCSRKYPIVEDIPVMLIDEGDKWVDTAADALPVPPPRPN